MDKLSLQAQKKIIKKLKKLIPDTTCPEGCFDCCTGPTFIQGFEMSEWEEQQLLKLQPTPVVPKDNSMDIDCHYLENGRCKIYKLRPMVCRMYGSIKMFDDNSCGSIPERTLTSKEKTDILILYTQVYDPRKRRE